MRSIVLAVVLAVSAAGAARAAEMAEVGKPAPGFRLPVYNPDAAGSAYLGLEHWVGPQATDKGTRVVVLSFMASWCPPCLKELPSLQSLHERYRDFGLRVVMVSIDDTKEGQAQMEALIAKHKVTFPVLKDRFVVAVRRWIPFETVDGKVTVPLPGLFMVRPDGTVSLVHRGYDESTLSLLEREVEGALGIQRKRGPATVTRPAP